jgi:hypothetical protein
VSMSKFPKIELPTYRLKLSTGEITFRPFTVKEEKLFLMAMESKDNESIVDAIKQVVSNCVLTEDFDVTTLPLFELEYLFLNLRARSVGEVVNLAYKCRTVKEDKSNCNMEMSADVDLLKAGIDMKNDVSGLSPVVKLTDTLKIKFKYPTIATSIALSKANKSGNFDDEMVTLKECTEYMFDDEEVYRIEEMPDGKFEEIIESLPPNKLEEVDNFFRNLPTLSHEIQMKCGSCGTEHKIKLEGLLDFFA